MRMRGIRLEPNELSMPSSPSSDVMHDAPGRSVHVSVERAPLTLPSMFNPKDFQASGFALPARSVSPKYILEMAKTVGVDAVAAGPVGLAGTAPAPVPVAGTAQHSSLQAALWGGPLAESQPVAATSVSRRYVSGKGGLLDPACLRPFTMVLRPPWGGIAFAVPSADLARSLRATCSFPATPVVRAAVTDAGDSHVRAARARHDRYRCPLRRGRGPRAGAPRMARARLGVGQFTLCRLERADAHSGARRRQGGRVTARSWRRR